MAFGTLKADTLTHSTEGSVDTKYAVSGSGKVWVNFDGTQTSITARDSFNVSAMVDDSASGEYQIQFTSNFSNNDYAPSGFVGSTGNSSGWVGGPNSQGDSDYGTGQLQISTFYQNAGEAEFVYVMTTIHGDLA
tara:strand:+ start:301 stop:702 length:402 start_codon:yes stop_codon:yes gene_type:complete